MWHSATCSFSNICNLILRLSWSFIATYHLFGTIGPCNILRNSIRTVEAFVPSKCNSVLSTCGFLPERWKESRPYSSLLATQQSVLETQGKVVQSPFLSELVNRGIISQATDLQGLDAFLCSYESGNASSHDHIPAIYYGIDLTNNFIHEGTLFQLFVLRRFLAHKFNVVIILGGGTTTVGDPSYKIRRSNAAVGSSDTGCHANNAILNQECIVPSSSPENTSAILDIVTKVLTQAIEIPGGDIVHPSLSFSSMLSESDVRRVTSSCYNVVCLNNRDLYDRVTLSEFLATVAGNMSVGRMLSRDCIKARMSFSESNATKLKANMNLAEFMYMSLQATDFIHVASKFNSILQLGGSDQMGNIMSGVDLSSSLGEAGKTVFGITTPLLRTPSGEKISKSVGEGLLKITTDTKPLAFWSHFRSVDDAVVEDYLRWLTRVPISLIKDTMSRHINDGKVLLADELTTAMFGRDYTDALHKYWLARDVGALTRSREDLSAEDYDSFVKFTKCVQSVALDPGELEGGVEFGSLLDQLRTPQMVSGKFYSNRRAIREGTCRINGSVVSSVNYKVGPGDLLRSSCKDGRVFKYITIQFGKHQLFFVILNQV